jgi:hypothetical protein
MARFFSHGPALAGPLTRHSRSSSAASGPVLQVLQIAVFASLLGDVPLPLAPLVDQACQPTHRPASESSEG